MPHISLSHPAVLLSVLFSQFRMKGMVLCSLGRSPCSCLSLAVAANSCKTLCERNLLSSWLSSFPKMLALITQMSSTFTEGKEGGKEAREESCVYFFVPGVHSPRIAPAIYECVWVHICTGTWRAGWYGRTPLYLSIALDTAGGEKKKISQLCACGRYLLEDHIGHTWIFTRVVLYDETRASLPFCRFWTWWKGRNC